MDKFDDIIKSKVQDFNPNPPDDSLHIILEHLNKRNSRKKTYYLTGIAASFIALLSFASIIIYKRSNHFNAGINKTVHETVNSKTIIKDSIQNENKAIAFVKYENETKSKNDTNTEGKTREYFNNFMTQTDSSKEDVNYDTILKIQQLYDSAKIIEPEVKKLLNKIVNFWKSLHSIYMVGEYKIYNNNSIKNILIDSVMIRRAEDESYFVKNPSDTIMHYNFYERNRFLNTYTFYKNDTLYTIQSRNDNLIKQHNDSINKLNRLDQFGNSAPYLGSIYSLPALISYFEDAIDNKNSRSIISVYPYNETIQIKISEIYYQYDLSNTKRKSVHELIINLNKFSLLPSETSSVFSISLDEKKCQSDFKIYQTINYNYNTIVLNKECNDALWSYKDYQRKKKQNKAMNIINQGLGKTLRLNEKDRSQDILTLIQRIQPYKIMGDQIVFNYEVNSITRAQGALIIVDGMKLGTFIDVFGLFQVADIETITVMTKPEDYAIYTSLNINGVIVIKTKRGE
jgi:hypothetical protein